MADNRKNNFIVQGSILAIAGIFSRIIGMLFRIPMLSIIGEDGMGVYSTAYSISFDEDGNAEVKENGNSVDGTAAEAEKKSR